MKIFKRWKFFLVWSGLAMAFLVGYDLIHDLPQDLYGTYPKHSQDLIFWAWMTANVIVSSVVGAFVTVADSSLNWFEERRNKKANDV